MHWSCTHLVMIFGVGFLAIPLSTAQPATISPPDDQEYTLSGNNEDQVVNKTQPSSSYNLWQVKANQYREAIFVVEGSPFKHVRKPDQYRRTARLSMSKTRGGRWTVVKGDAEADPRGSAEVMARKSGPGGGRAEFQVTVTFVEEGTGLAPSGEYEMTLQGTIRAGN
jgi:hypothetical protein